jgi:hypothetical protein
MPQDRAAIVKYLNEEWSGILEGWKEGEGSSKLKPQRIRVLEGGLEKVSEGLAIMAKGEYGREKLVCSIV